MRWKEILKWRPDETYKEYDSYISYADGYKTEEPARGKNYQNTVLVTGHYIDRGNERFSDDKEELDGWAKTILGRISDAVKQGNWMYRSEDNDEIVMFDKIGPNETLPQQQGKNKIKNTTGRDIIVFTTAYPAKRSYKVDEDKWFDIWDEGEIRRNTGLKTKRKRIPVNLVDLIPRLDRQKRLLESNTKFISERSALAARLRRQSFNLPKKKRKDMNRQIAEIEQGLKEAKDYRKNLQESVTKLQQQVDEAKRKEEEK